MFGDAAVRRDSAELVIDSGSTPIRYMPRERFLALYPGVAPQRHDDHPALLSFHVPDVRRTEAVLRAGGLAPVAAPDGRVLVPASDAAGVAIEFKKG